MKKLLILLTLLCVNTFYAQKGSKPQPAQSSKQANDWIEYTNALASFMEQYFNGAVLERYISDVNLSLRLNRENISVSNFNSNKGSLTESIQLFEDQLNNDRFTPIKILTPPSSFPSVEKKQLLSLIYKYESLMNKSSNIINDIDATCISKKDNDKLLDDKVALFNSKFTTLKATQNEISQTIDSVYELTHKVGSDAEKIILAKHPLKEEIFDMKDAMNYTRKFMQKIDISSLETIKSSRELAKPMLEKLKAIQQKYLSKTESNGNKKTEYMKDHSIKFFKKAVSSFNKSTDDFIYNLEATINGDDMYKRKDESYIMKDVKYYLESSYEGIYSSYNEFVKMNNSN
jgi:hypothetical protein